MKNDWQHNVNVCVRAPSCHVCNSAFIFFLSRAKIILVPPFCKMKNSIKQTATSEIVLRCLWLVDCFVMGCFTSRWWQAVSNMRSADLTCPVQQYRPRQFICTVANILPCISHYPAVAVTAAASHITNMAFCVCFKCLLFLHLLSMRTVHLSFLLFSLCMNFAYLCAQNTKYLVENIGSWNTPSPSCVYPGYMCASIYVRVLPSADDGREKRKILVSTRGTVEKVRTRHSKLEPLSLSC